MPHKASVPWCFPLLVLVVGLLGVASVGMQPRPGTPVAAVFPPWWSLARVYGAVAAADGSILRTGAWPAVVVTYSPEPGFAARLNAAGAWFLLDPLGLGMCGDPARRAT